jgi:hypothetical protein
MTGTADCIPYEADDVAESSELPLYDRSRFDFRAHSAVPCGWEIDGRESPDVFRQFGRDTCVIARIERHEGMRVLAAIPKWAIDMRRARRLSEFLVGKRISSVALEEVKSVNTLVCSSLFPKGLSLEQWTQEYGALSEGVARTLCKDLLRALHELHTTPLTLCGLAFPSMIFLDDVGELTTFLPLSYVLSWRGAKSLAIDMGTAEIAPEVERGFEEGCGWKDSERADLYAVLAIVFRAMTGARSWKVYDQRYKAGSSPLSEAAADFFKRVLYKDPLWRLAIDDAIQHRWCNGNA